MAVEVALTSNPPEGCRPAGATWCRRSVCCVRVRDGACARAMCMCQTHRSSLGLVVPWPCETVESHGVVCMRAYPLWEWHTPLVAGPWAAQLALKSATFGGVHSSLRRVDKRVYSVALLQPRS